MRSLPLIELKNCSVKFGACLALDRVNFCLHAQQRWVLVGANGSGKSVLLKLLRGDLWPTPTGEESRHYALGGIVQSEPYEDKHQIAYLAPERQDKYLRYDWNLSVTQLVTTGLFDEDIPLTKPSTAQRVQVRRKLRQLRLWSLRERRLFTLSYGQRRRALLARMLVAQPPVLLLDEVFNGIDVATRQLLQRLLANTRQHPTWVLAAHSLEDIPDNATHLLRLKQGRVVYAGPLDRAQLEPLRRDAQARHRTARRQVMRAALPALKASKADELITLQNVTLYRDYRFVLREVNWTLRRGEHWAIMGANGSGKSSLLLLLYGDLHPAHSDDKSGAIVRHGMKPGTPITQWKQRVGYVSPELQAAHYRAGTLEDVVGSGRYASIGLNQALTAADRRAARPWLKFFGLLELRQRHPRQVSYGQLRLALMARAMINRPQLLLLDEPFTGLDPQMHAYALAALQRLAEAGTQVVMAIHDQADVLPAVTQVLEIERGKVAARAYKMAQNH